MKKILYCLSILAILLLRWIYPVESMGSRARARSFNLLLITIDTLRADHLGCYGYKEVKTPAIDRLASEGGLFNRAFTPVPITFPSHVTIMTGLYPIQHGIRNNGIGSAYLKQNDIDNAYRILKALSARNPNNGEALINLGTAHYENKVVEVAIKLWERAEELEYEDPRIHYNLALGYFSLLDYTCATRELKETLRIEPGNQQALMLLNKVNALCPPPVSDGDRAHTRTGSRETTIAGMGV